MTCIGAQLREKGEFSPKVVLPLKRLLCLDLVRQEACDSSDFTLEKRVLIGTAQFLCKYFSQKRKKFHYGNSYSEETFYSVKYLHGFEAKVHWLNITPYCQKCQQMVILGT